MRAHHLEAALEVFERHRLAGDDPFEARFQLRLFRGQQIEHGVPGLKHAPSEDAFNGDAFPHRVLAEIERAQRDRKSTRLNSSHVSISYAVFCLKKKKKKL